jgi:hypothetical protein
MKATFPGAHIEKTAAFDEENAIKYCLKTRIQDQQPNEEFYEYGTRPTPIGKKGSAGNPYTIFDFSSDEENIPPSNAYESLSTIWTDHYSMLPIPPSRSSSPDTTQSPDYSYLSVIMGTPTRHIVRSHRDIHLQRRRIRPTTILSTIRSINFD